MIFFCLQVGLFEYHSPDLPLSEWDETQGQETRVWQQLWQLNPACGGRPANLKSKFGDISDLFKSFWLLPNNLLFFFSFPFAFITDSPTNKRLLSGRFVTLIQGRNLWTALSTSRAAYSCYCLSLHSRKTASKEVEGEEGLGDGGEREGQTWTVNESGENRSLEEERSGVERRERGVGGCESLNRFCGRKEVWIFQFYPAH